MQSEQIKTVVLQPIKETTEDFEKIERAIRKLFRDEVYLPLIKQLGGNRNTLQNANDALNGAIKSGRIQFYRGTFSGRFNASISRELKALGAQWDRKTRTFKLPQSSLPPETKTAIALSEARFQQQLASIDKQLKKIVPEKISEQLKVSQHFDTTLFKTEKSFQRSMKGLVVPPSLSENQRKRISDEWEKNMQLWIKDFTQKEILELRQNMQKSVFAGNRYESAVKTIQKSYDVTVNKAKFLARQETSLLMTKFKQTRYQEAGVDKYLWGCVAGSANHPVRPWHKALEGKVFRWDNPPITTKPGEPVRRNNPGQDYNCRCFAKPIVRFKKGSK